MPSLSPTPLDQKLKELLSGMPCTGSGQKLVYKHMIKVATAFYIRGYTFEEFERWSLENFTTSTCGRYPEGNDLTSAWQFATNQSVIASGSTSNSGNWPDASPARAEQVVASMPGVGVQNIRDSERNQVAGFDTWGILQRLFYPKCLVGSGEDFYTPVIRSLEFLNDSELLARQQFIVPNPMAKRSGKARTGKASVRCADSACKPENQRWQVIEFDFKKFDDNGKPTIGHDTMVKWEQDGISIKDAQAYLQGYLLREHRLRLGMVVDTGGKSLHAWYNVRNMATEAQREFKRDAADLGADSLLYRLEQWTRFPNGTRLRPDGATVRQEVIYFDPDACATNDTTSEMSPRP